MIYVPEVYDNIQKNGEKEYRGINKKTFFETEKRIHHEWLAEIESFLLITPHKKFAGLGKPKQKLNGYYY